MTYTGGDVESAEGDLQLGGKITVRFFVQNLGKIPRIWGNGFVGDQRVNKWGLILGSITDSSAPDELLFAIGGGIVGIRPDPDAKGHYIVRELIPLSAGGSVALQRLQTRAR